MGQRSGDSSLIGFRVWRWWLRDYSSLVYWAAALGRAWMTLREAAERTGFNDDFLNFPSDRVPLEFPGRKRIERKKTKPAVNA